MALVPPNLTDSEEQLIARVLGTYIDSLNAVMGIPDRQNGIFFALGVIVGAITHIADADRIRSEVDEAIKGAHERASRERLSS
jgi:hypothetical protein